MFSDMNSVRLRWTRAFQFTHKLSYALTQATHMGCLTITFTYWLSHTHTCTVNTHILTPALPTFSQEHLLVHSHTHTLTLFSTQRSHTEIPPPQKNKHMLYLPPPWLRLTELPTNSPAFPVVSWPERKRVTDEVHIDAAKRKCSSPPAPSTASLQLPWRIFQDGELFLSLLGRGVHY